MKNEVILKVENVSKQYRLGMIGTGTISHDLNRFFARIRGKEDPYLKIGETNSRSTKGTSEYVWALKDINFEVNRGEILGIIGKNGAGKSTLLKILSKVTAPTTGIIKSKGRIASLLEVGTGFHPEMTGKENVYLNGAILGMTKKEITAKFDEIVAFSGCERYIDTPVKRYSSGMKVRLAFAVAAFLEPDILVVDEVLAVGDAEFQKKAIGKMQDISNTDGRTVLFVSHDMSAISSLCPKCILLNDGQIHSIGKTSEIINLYFNGKNIISSGFDLIINSISDYEVVFQTLLKSDLQVQSGRFFIKLIDYNGTELMLFEKKMSQGDSVLKKFKLNISSLNDGIYSLQAKVWATSLTGKDLAIATPFYPIHIKNKDPQHKRVFAGELLEI
ncbi:hypothetical protein GCM10011416_17400 [Polaribacter pacificus]|uniref:ABC transporter domain-containing protein n=1 Tax=Polaribacter pacificus TaxID=1775173 RepID=A0A917MEN4_9FLAO|nr:ABC transporter ATP-binding protein [Polaribacter pacificus]GGG99563.1 hypothetical protein GCM10011416_17400 [Polaribacter pacificus]